MLELSRPLEASTRRRALTRVAALLLLTLLLSACDEDEERALRSKDVTTFIPFNRDATQSNTDVADATSDQGDATADVAQDVTDAPTPDTVDDAVDALDIVDTSDADGGSLRTDATLQDILADAEEALAPMALRASLVQIDAQGMRDDGTIDLTSSGGGNVWTLTYDEINTGSRYIVTYEAGAADADFPTVTIQPGLSGMTSFTAASLPDSPDIAQRYNADGNCTDLSLGSILHVSYDTSLSLVRVVLNAWQATVESGTLSVRISC